MKTITMAAALLLAAVLQTMGAVNYNSSKSNTGNFTLTCDGGSCTAAHVTDVNAWPASTGGKMKSLGDVKAVSLGKDGTLTCVQNSGAGCTPDQGKALAESYKPTAAWKEPGKVNNTTTRSNTQHN
jgi:hypothetical protein